MKKLWPLLLVLVAACNNPKQAYNADLIVKNAVVYTVDSNFTVAQAFVVKGGRILAVGDSASILEKYHARDVIDAGGHAVYPGFIDAHSHFVEYCTGLQEANLRGMHSWQQIVDTLVSFARGNTDGWLIGRGWDQNLWKNKKFPNKAKLDSLFPVRPVFLERIDGHAAIANQAALNLAGIKAGQKITGGGIEAIKGKLTGILVDNAVGIVTRKIPPMGDDDLQNALLDGQKNCFADGLTTVADCGLPYTDISPIAEEQRKGTLKIRLYVMLSDRPDSYDYLFKHGVYKTPGLDVRGFKMYADGALGSRGACLLQDYSDSAKWRGYLLSTAKHFAEVAQKVYAHGFQLSTHAIGDSANRLILKIYAGVLKGKNDRRWRIEHAQVLAPGDIKLFGDNSIIPSVQPTHATSDMLWAVKRLGPKRIQTAYANKQLLAQNGWLPLGTDFPVENISPIYTFYAAVIRKNLAGQPADGFQMENALSREEALRGITIWAAKAQFEEREKGSIEAGKYADFVMLDQDIMKTDGSQLPKVMVLKTYINGEKVYEKK